MKVRIASLALALALLAGSASAQSVGVFWDPAGGTCATTQTTFTPGTMYILAILGGASSGGLTGAEFRTDNFPTGWFPTANPNPAAAVSVGSALGTGCNIAFASCQSGTGGVVLLYTVTYFAASAEVDRHVAILRHSSPSNPAFLCPLHVLCDAPVFTKICVSGGQGIINGGNCTVAVEQKSWSGVKNLYQD